jgi:hypothetical protein
MTRNNVTLLWINGCFAIPEIHHKDPDVDDRVMSRMILHYRKPSNVYLHQS